MRNISSFTLGGFLLIATCGAYAAPANTASKSVQARLDEQNALFEDQFQTDLVMHPERATAIGDYRYNDRLDDYSIASAQKQHAVDEGFRARLSR